MNWELMIGVCGILLAAPGALLHWRDLRGQHPGPLTATNTATNKTANAAAPVHAGRPLTPPSSAQHGQTEATHGVPGSSVVPLSLPRRFLSSFVDTYAVVLVGLIAIGFGSGAGQQPGDDGSAAYGLGLLLGWLAVSWISSRTGKSPGRLLVGGRLVPVDDPQGRVSFGKTLLRSVIAFALNSFFWLSLWFGLSSAERATLHDRWTATRVIRTRGTNLVNA